MTLEYAIPLDETPPRIPERAEDIPEFLEAITRVVQAAKVRTVRTIAEAHHDFLNQTRH